MTNFRRVLSILCIGVTLFACSGPGKKESSEKPPFVPREKFVSTIYDTKPFNLNTVQLFPGYIGHNPELLYNTIRLRQEVVRQRPGEPPEEHRSRIAREIYRPLMGSVDFDSTFAFRITPQKRAYNTSRKALELDASLVGVFEKGHAIPKKAFMARYVPQLDNSYEITDKTGLKRTFEEKKFSQYAILPVDSTGKASENRGKIAATVLMTREEAQKSEGDITFLIIGRLASPYASYEEVNQNPLPGSSGTYLARYHYLHVHSIDIWVYDMSSGQILLKQSKSSGIKFQE